MATAEQLLTQQTTAYARLGYTGPEDMTLGELRDVVALLVERGYDESTRVSGSSSLTILQPLPPLTPALVRQLQAGTR